MKTILTIKTCILFTLLTFGFSNGMNITNSEIPVSQNKELIQSSPTRSSIISQYQYPDNPKEKFLTKLAVFLSSYLTNTEITEIFTCLEPAFYQQSPTSEVIDKLLSCAFGKIPPIKYLKLLQMIPSLIQLLQCEILGDCTQSGNIQSDLTTSE